MPEIASGRAIAGNFIAEKKPAIAGNFQPLFSIAMEFSNHNDTNTTPYVPAKLVPTPTAMGPISCLRKKLGLCECGGGVWVRGWRVDVGVRGDVTARLWLCDNSVCVCV